MHWGANRKTTLLVDGKTPVLDLDSPQGKAILEKRGSPPVPMSYADAVKAADSRNHEKKPNGQWTMELAKL